MSVSSKMIKLGLLLLPYGCLQVIHGLTLPNFKRECVGLAENPTEERDWYWWFSTVYIR